MNNIMLYKENLIEGVYNFTCTHRKCEFCRNFKEQRKLLCDLDDEIKRMLVNSSWETFCLYKNFLLDLINDKLYMTYHVANVKVLLRTDSCYEFTLTFSMR